MAKEASDTMGESLNIIALISGGKDSFYSILHCIQNGHKVVALGNLHPPSNPRSSHSREATKDERASEEDEQDLSSFMYQTVGHTIIPLYETALGIPLYRQQIIGSTVQTGTSYIHATDPSARIASSGTVPEDESEDETESLIPLLKRIKSRHPEANAVSTGAILSTYQRTRVESVALRLGLTPLSYLWQYPNLESGTQTSLLGDMQAVGLDARIVKVASGGLDETFLWENVASGSGMRRVERSMKRFGVDGDGGVLGEGGEYETLVIDGPVSLFKGRIQIHEEDRRVVRENGGAAWLSFSEARVVMKAHETGNTVCRIPDVLEQRFRDVLDSLKNDGEVSEMTSRSVLPSSLSTLNIASRKTDLSNLTASRNSTLTWTVRGCGSSQTIADEAAETILKIRQLLHQSSLDPTSIVSTTILLRSMLDFASVNIVYGTLFTAPNPPSRVTISCGSLMPKGTNILILVKLASFTLNSQRKGLHVQSRSYWAPANIGPYSQATSLNIPNSKNTESDVSVVSIAGQIPLIPASMTLPAPSADLNPRDDFKFQTTLSLQHLFRIGIAMSVSWFTGTVAYLSSSQNPCNAAFPTVQRAKIAGQAWKMTHSRPDPLDNNNDEQPRDLWEEKYYAGMITMGGVADTKSLPDWEVVSLGDGNEKEGIVPSFWAAEVEELPRGADIEWAALTGVVGGPVQVDYKAKKGSWTVQQTRFGNLVQSVVKVLSGNDDAIDQRAGEALRLVGLEADSGPVASWLDCSVEDTRRAWEDTKFGGLVPCRSLWDADGVRLAAVFVFETEAPGTVAENT